MLFTKASKDIKCVGINLTKNMKELYTANYKAMLRDIKDVNK